jgi:signal transduction histidine kinase
MKPTLEFEVPADPGASDSPGRPEAARILFDPLLASTAREVNEARARKLVHDLGNYLTAISGLAQMGRLVSVAEAKDVYLARIEFAVNDMARLLQEILTNRAADLREALDAGAIRALLLGVVDLVSPRFQAKGVRLGLQCAPGIPVTRIAPLALRQVLINVLDNALRATEAGGEVLLGACRSHRPPGIRLSVKDNGVGIPKHLLRQVFLPGYTTRADGYGLGLTIAREIVEVMHGGRLSLRSAPGQGTTVVLLLPC